MAETVSDEQPFLPWGARRKDKGIGPPEDRWSKDQSKAPGDWSEEFGDQIHGRDRRVSSARKFLVADPRA